MSAIINNSNTSKNPLLAHQEQLKLLEKDEANVSKSFNGDYTDLFFRKTLSSDQLQNLKTNISNAKKTIDAALKNIQTLSDKLPGAAKSLEIPGLQHNLKLTQDRFKHHEAQANGALELITEACEFAAQQKSKASS